MASLLLAVLTTAASQPASGAGEAISGVFGSISLTAWICLLLPQLITNYKAQSADGLSMAFLFVWLFGDVANLSGALFANLAPTAIALAIYFCIADIALIGQCTYYNTLNARRRKRHEQIRASHHGDPHKHASSPGSNGTAILGDDVIPTASTGGAEVETTEESPLLARQRHGSSSGSIGRRHSHGHHSMRRHSEDHDALSRIVTAEGEISGGARWLHNALGLVAVYAVGAAGWFVSWRMGFWEAGPGVPDPGDAVEPTAVIGVVLGYLSAAAYLCARIPQIIKNYREKSCDGLSLLFFLLSLTGNFTYGASLLAYSQDGDYLVRALPWLLGSLGTIVEDLIIFFQFRLYADQRPKTDAAV